MDFSQFACSPSHWRMYDCDLQLPNSEIACPAVCDALLSPLQLTIYVDQHSLSAENSAAICFLSVELP